MTILNLQIKMPFIKKNSSSQILTKENIAHQCPQVCYTLSERFGQDLKKQILEDLCRVRKLLERNIKK
jgi:hypothetical protein